MLSTMKFIIDDKIPYIQGVLEPFGEVLYLSGEKMTPEVVKKADALITRTRTICNEKLLSGSSVRFIATATIGYDHIDTAYCNQNNIRWTNAPGCNSSSVEQYILSALLVMAERQGILLEGKTMGVVGVGQVGSKVARVCRLLGMNVLLNDPPRARMEGSAMFSDLEELMRQADFLSFHTPLTMEGQDATYHMADRTFFSGLKRKPIVLNSCRGEVFDTPSVKWARQEGLISGLVVDCWENEPRIDLDYLQLADLATPHIAGYSKDGKAKGTSMSVQALSRFFHLGLDTWEPEIIEPPLNPQLVLDGFNRTNQDVLSEAILWTYDIRLDDAAFRHDPGLFEKLRGEYPNRREFPAYSIKGTQIRPEMHRKLEMLGFKQ